MNPDPHTPPVPHFLTVAQLIDVLSMVRDPSRPVGIVDIDQVNRMGDVSLTHDYRITYNYLTPGDLSGVGVLLWSARAFYKMIEQQHADLNGYLAEVARRKQELLDNMD